MTGLGKTVAAAVLIGIFAPASALRADPLRIMLPAASGTITDADGDGIGDSYSSGLFMLRADGLVRSAVLEYDISALEHVRWATVETVIIPEDRVDTGQRRVGAYVFVGNGAIGTDDFAAPGILVGTHSFRPGEDPTVGGWWWGPSVTHQLRAAVARDAGFFGVRLMALNDQPASTFGSTLERTYPPLLVVNPAPVPEPASLVLLGSGLAALAARARRRRRAR